MGRERQRLYVGLAPERIAGGGDGEPVLTDATDREDGRSGVHVYMFTCLRAAFGRQNVYLFTVLKTPPARARLKRKKERY